jgi:hypothetical protein
MASGDTLAWLHPLAAEPKTGLTTYPTHVSRNDHRVLSFDGTNNQAAMYTLIMPSWYANGGITVYVHWAAASGTTGVTVWGASVESLAPGAQSLDSDLFGPEVLESSTAPGIAGETEEVLLSVSHADMGGTAAGDPCRIKIRRLPANTGDTMTVAAHMLIAEVREA